MSEDHDNANANANGAGDSGDNVPPPAEPGVAPGTINVRFRDQHGQDIQFKMKPTTKMGKAMDAFSARVQRERKTLRFVFEGIRMIDEQTAAELDMDDECTVDVYEEQIGGASFP